MINIYTLIEWCITSSVLILLVMILRLITKKHISPMLRYSLWLVVLIRLLLPINPLDSIFSVMNTAEPILNSTPGFRAAIDLTYHDPAGFFKDSFNNVCYQAPTTSWRYLVFGIWGYGMFIVTDNIVYNNWRLWRRLKLNRKPLLDHTDPTRPRLYSMDGIASPCLFGPLRPSIYLTGASLQDPQVQTHAIAHERAHYRHGDHIWSVLRLVALILHWYNPLVWWACFLSKQDGEAAADDLAIRTLGAESRLSYGQTLIQLVAKRKISFSILSCSTTMVSSMISSKRALRKRILTLARAPRTTRLAAGFIGVILLTSILFTFTGAQASDWFDRTREELKEAERIQARLNTTVSELVRKDFLSRYPADECPYTDISDQLPAFLGYDEELFTDYCMYEFQNGYVIGAVDIREGEWGKIQFSMDYMVREYIRDHSLVGYTNPSTSSVLPPSFCFAFGEKDCVLLLQLEGIADRY